MDTIEPPRRKLTGAIVPTLAAAALAGLATMAWVWPRSEATQAPAGCILDNIQTFGGPISLIDANGQALTQADFSSGPAVLYFGFTHCPDVCPTTLYALGQALSAPGGYDIQPVFITVDPERDTPALLRDYAKTNGFPAGLVGLTGTTAQVRAAADAFKVSFRHGHPQGGDLSVYDVDHTSFLYVVDAHWRTRAVLNSMGQTPQTIAACISAALSPRRGAG